MKIDKKVIKEIKRYIESNDISINKLSKESGIPYHRLWTIINYNQAITLGDYLLICKAFKEPFDFFLPKEA